MKKVFTVEFEMDQSRFEEAQQELANQSVRHQRMDLTVGSKVIVEYGTGEIVYGEITGVGDWPDEERE